MGRIWIIGFFALLVGAAEMHGYFWGQRVAARNQAVAEAIARNDFMQDDLRRQAIDDETESLARQLERENYAAPIAIPDAFGRDRVRRINNFAPSAAPCPPLPKLPDRALSDQEVEAALMLDSVMYLKCANKVEVLNGREAKPLGVASQIPNQ